MMRLWFLSFACVVVCKKYYYIYEAMRNEKVQGIKNEPLDLDQTVDIDNKLMAVRLRRRGRGVDGKIYMDHPIFIYPYLFINQLYLFIDFILFLVFLGRKISTTTMVSTVII